MICANIRIAPNTASSTHISKTVPLKIICRFISINVEMIATASRDHKIASSGMSVKYFKTSAVTE